MPPVRKFTREDIVNAACEIVRQDGFKGLNARKIAKELNCSVQPIFHNFETMEELSQAVYDKIYLKYQEVMKQAMDEEHPYLAKGVAYVRFAREYPEFYKIIFMQESEKKLEEFIQADIDVSKNVMEAITQKFDISEKDLQDFHIKVWIFTHGLACLAATKTIAFTDDEIRSLLMNTVQEMFQGYSIGRKA